MRDHVVLNGRGANAVVEVDHAILASPRSNDGLRVTTNRLFLPAARFDPKVVEAINSADAEKGRRLYCIDRRTGEAVAALSYHIDLRRRVPVVVTAVALRIDVEASGDSYDCSRAAAFLLTQYVHEIAKRIGRGGHVDIDAIGLDGFRDLSTLGFARATGGATALRPTGTHFRQSQLS